MPSGISPTNNSHAYRWAETVLKSILEPKETFSRPYPNRHLFFVQTQHPSALMVVLFLTLKNWSIGLVGIFVPLLDAFRILFVSPCWLCLGGFERSCPLAQRVDQFAQSEG